MRVLGRAGWLALVLTAGVSGAAHADFSSSALGTTGAQFLELPVGARGAAMGSAQGAVVNDATALHYNPAGLAGVQGGDAVLMHAAYLETITYQYLGIAQKLHGGGTVGIGLQHLSFGSVEQVDNSGASAGASLHPRDFALTMGYGRRWGRMEVGASAKYISSQISHSAQTMALDAGGRTTVGRWILSASVANMGPGLKYREKREALPLGLRLGSATRLRDWTLAADLIAPRGALPHIALGAEFARSVSGAILAAGRLGYTSRYISSRLGAITGFGLGGGIVAGRYALDYALMPFGDMGVIHRISAGIHWGAPVRGE